MAETPDPTTPDPTTLDGTAPAVTPAEAIVSAPGTAEASPDAASTQIEGSSHTPAAPTTGAGAARGEEAIDVDDLPAGARGALEAVLMVVEEPVSETQLASALDLSVPRVHELLTELAAEFDRDERGFALMFVGGGWRMYSRTEYAPVVERFLLDGQRAKLTQAALETLAVVAYRQPISRARVSAVRGVNVDGVVRTLLTRGLITEVGVDDEHGAVLYGTTAYFLQRLGLGSLDDLPPLAPYLPEIDMLDDLTDGPIR